MPKTLSNWSGVAVAGAVKDGPGGRRHEILRVGRRLVLLDPETDETVREPRYKSWEALLADWPDAVQTA